MIMYQAPLKNVHNSVPVTGDHDVLSRQVHVSSLDTVSFHATCSSTFTDTECYQCRDAKGHSMSSGCMPGAIASDTRSCCDMTPESAVT